MEQLLKVDTADWTEAVHGQEEYFAKFGTHLPAGIQEEHETLAHKSAFQHLSE